MSAFYGFQVSKAPTWLTKKHILLKQFNYYNINFYSKRKYVFDVKHYQLKSLTFFYSLYNLQVSFVKVVNWGFHFSNTCHFLITCFLLNMQNFNKQKIKKNWASFTHECKSNTMRFRGSNFLPCMMVFLSVFVFNLRLLKRLWKLYI